MPETFKDRAGNPLEEGLYTILPKSWPLSFQGYKWVMEGDFRMFEAAFRDYQEKTFYFNQSQVSLLATRATPEEAKKYMQMVAELQKIQLLPNL